MESVTWTLTIWPCVALTKARRLPEGQRRPLALSLVTLLPGQHRAHLWFVPSAVTSDQRGDGRARHCQALLGHQCTWLVRSFYGASGRHSA